MAASQILLPRSPLHFHAAKAHGMFPLFSLLAIPEAFNTDAHSLKAGMTITIFNNEAGPAHGHSHTMWEHGTGWYWSMVPATSAFFLGFHNTVTASLKLTPSIYLFVYLFTQPLWLLKACAP